MTLANSDTFEKISAILKAHTAVTVPITPDLLIGADLAIDSVQMFDLVMEIEDAYDISFPIEEASGIDTVQSLVEAIERLKNV
ncbi:MAG: acyl carrier protein [Rhodobacteraceae bacterium]|jgi:acyl carrier protein|nr:acyl carrier protein [Paracoccaceae bacterium]